jgi:RNA polymerase sigma-70 factor, ECF subfamily
VALSEHDKQLLERCLEHQPRSWQDFVDRFMGLVMHVINHSTQSRNMKLNHADIEDLVSEVFLNIVRNDFQLLREFRGESSLATYLTVVTRRIAVAQLLKIKPTVPLNEQHTNGVATNGHHQELDFLQNRDQVEKLLDQLDSTEAELIKLYHLDGKSYDEISQQTGVAANSIGPTLTRARQKMRQAVERVG